MSSVISNWGEDSETGEHSEVVGPGPDPAQPNRKDSSTLSSELQDKSVRDSDFLVRLGLTPFILGQDDEFNINRLIENEAVVARLVYDVRASVSRMERTLVSSEVKCFSRNERRKSCGVCAGRYGAEVYGRSDSATARGRPRQDDLDIFPDTRKTRHDTHPTFRDCTRKLLTLKCGILALEDMIDSVCSNTGVAGSTANSVHWSTDDDFERQAAVVVYGPIRRNVDNLTSLARAVVASVGLPPFVVWNAFVVPSNADFMMITFVRHVYTSRFLGLFNRRGDRAGYGSFVAFYASEWEARQDVIAAIRDEAQDRPDYR